MNNCMEVWAPGRIVQNNLTRYSNICQTVPTNNYWTPLTEQVEDSESKDILNNIIHKNNHAVFDTAATSSAGKPGDNFIPTTERSDKIFKKPSGAQMEATYIHKLKRNVRDPAGRVGIMPDLAQDSLISGPKFAEAGYVTL